MEAGEDLVNDEDVVFNPVALRIVECGGLDTIKSLSGTAKVVKKYFGEKYEEYLLKRRGLNTKKANQAS